MTIEYLAILLSLSLEKRIAQRLSMRYIQILNLSVMRNNGAVYFGEDEGYNITNTESGKQLIKLFEDRFTL
jgi:hypothetical protein